MNYSEIRKLSLKVFIGFLGLTALIAIISVLSGDFGKLQWKILATCFTISAASICSMSCAVFIEKKGLAGLGLAGIFLCISSASLVIVGIWPEIESEEYWNPASKWLRLQFPDRRSGAPVSNRTTSLLDEMVTSP